MLPLTACTCLSKGTGVWRVWVAMVITEVFGDVVACQLSHNVGDVSIRAEVLQPFMSPTWWRTKSTAVTTTELLHPYLLMHEKPRGNLENTYVITIYLLSKNQKFVCLKTQYLKYCQAKV